MLNFGSVDNGAGAGGYWAINPNSPNDITVKNCSGVFAQLPADTSFSMSLSNTALSLKSAALAFIDSLTNSFIYNGVFNVINNIAALYSQDGTNGNAATVTVSDSQIIDVAASEGNGDKASGLFVRNDYTQISAVSNSTNKQSTFSVTQNIASIRSRLNAVNELTTEQDIYGHRIKNSGGIIFEILKNGNIRTNQTVAHDPTYNHQTNMLPIYDETGTFKGMVMLYTT